MEKQFFKPEDVTGIIGVSRTQVYKLMASGELESVCVAGTSRRITKKGLEAFVRRKTEEANSLTREDKS